MSNALGIASVTHVLKDLLNDGLINQNASAAVGTAITVSSLPPGQVEPQQGSANSQLNLFMYRVSYNSGWSNVGYPSRNSSGEVISNPPLALNLHYLLTAFGEAELHSEILLGFAMQLLHENPTLDRNLIRNSLSVASVTNPGGRLPIDLLALAGSGLAEQIELIKIAPEPLNTEEMSKLWTAFQTKYRPCTAYVATVVLIESDKPASSPLPVMRRNVYAVPFRQPVINKILSSPNVANATINEFRRIVTGDILVLEGEQLKSVGVTVKIGEVEIAPNDADISATRISVELNAGLGLKAGIHGVQVVQPNVVVEGKRNLTNWEELDGWATATNYALEEVVVIHNVAEESSIAYRCLVAHISTGNFSNDLDNNNWEILAKRRRFKGTYSNLQAFVLSPTITGTNVVANVVTTTPQWAGATSYLVGNLVEESSIGYRCLVAHTSSAVFANDLDAGNWVIDGFFTADIEVEVSPNLQKGQRVMLILNETNLAAGAEPVSYSFILPSTIAAPVNSVTFEIKTDIKAGVYLVRIQVDGAASPLTTNANGEFIGPTLTIP